LNELFEAYTDFVSETYEYLTEQNIQVIVAKISTNENVKSATFYAGLIEIELNDEFIEDNKQSIIDVFLYGGVLRKKVGEDIQTVRIEGYGAL